MLRRNNLRRLLQQTLLPKVIIVFSSMLLLVTDFSYLTYASFFRPDANTIVTVPEVIYPSTPGFIAGDPANVRGTGGQVVLRVGNALVPSDFPQFFPGDLPCQTLVFLEGIPKPNDFVYAIKVQYTGSENAPLGRVQVGTLNTPANEITSIGYCQDQGVRPSKHFRELVNGVNRSLDFLFVDPFIIKGDLNEKSAILFYTSPNPPDVAPTIIISSAIGSQGELPGPPPPPDPSGSVVQSPIFGPAQAIEIVKEVTCRDAKGVMIPFRKDPLPVAKGAGATVVYRFTVNNKRKENAQFPFSTYLANVTISDVLPGFPKTIPDPIPPKQSASLTSEFPADTLPVDATGKFTNTATAEGDYNILDQNGIPTGQTVRVSAKSAPPVEVTLVENGGLCGRTVKCDTICFRPPILCQIFFDRLPAGTILIAGVNNNNPINIQTNGTLIRNALIPCPISFCTLTPLQYFNQQFVAAQLSLAAVGGPGSPSGINALWSNLNCYSTLTNFPPVTLSNGVTLTPNSMLKELFEQARKVITENRTAANRASDMTKLADLLKLLNSTCNKL